MPKETKNDILIIKIKVYVLLLGLGTVIKIVSDNRIHQKKDCPVFLIKIQNNMETIINRKSFKNVEAFLRMDVNGEIFVDCKFYDGWKSYPGPSVSLSLRPTPALMAEIRQRGTWAAPMSPELEQFARAAWTEAAEKSSWFRNE